MPQPSFFVFGPQRALPSVRKLTWLRNVLVEESALQPLLSAITELASHPVNGNWPSWHNASQRSTKEQLQNWISTGDVSTWSIDSPNALLSTLSVLSDLCNYVSYCGLLQNDHEGHAASWSAVQAPSQAVGLCIGALSAQVVSATQGRLDDFVRCAAVAVRLAFAVGSIVDAHSYQEPSSVAAEVFTIRFDEHRTSLLDLLIQQTPGAYVSVRHDRGCWTVTLPQTASSVFSHALSCHSFDYKKLALRGAFHTSANEAAFQELLRQCGSRSEMQMTITDAPYAAPHGAAQRESASDRHPGETLRSILVKQEDWTAKLEEAFNRLPGGSCNEIVAFGDYRFIPRTFLQSVKAHASYQDAPILSQPSSPQNHCNPAISTPSDHLSKDQPYRDSDIAVIGMACRVPGARTLDDYWALTQSGVSNCKNMKSERFGSHDLNNDQIFWGNVCEDIDSFDNGFFNISAREASHMDPQQRFMLEIAYEALQDAAYLRSTRRELNVGCFLGVGAVEYYENVSTHDDSAFSAPGTLRTFIPGRINHHFGWTGPALCIDTACSSSLVAIHNACTAIKAGDCDMALAGGASLMVSPKPHQQLAKAGFLSPHGASRAFDAAASGYCRGEGAGAVILKKATDAYRDGDDIRAIIAGSAVNQGENDTPITVPSSPSQAALYKKVIKMSRTNPMDVCYVEAHGTGTPVGDPIEMESIRSVFGTRERPTPLFVGSTKSNIGHLESASGIAALIRTILILQNRLVPPQANFTKLNPNMEHVTEFGVEVARQPRALLNGPALVTNYGAAGSNAALMLYRPKDLTRFSAARDQIRNLSEPKYPVRPVAALSYPFVLTSTSQQGLQRCASAVKQWLAVRHPDNIDVASLANEVCRRADAALPYVYSFVAPSIMDLQQKLSNETGFTSTSTPRAPASVVLCFSGQTRDFVGLDLRFYETCRLFRYYIDEVEQTSRSMNGPSLFPAIFQQTTIADLPTLHTAIFASQYASAKSWIASGLHPATLIGHSFGQLTAACISGSMSLPTSLKLIQGRARLFDRTSATGRGAMLSVSCAATVMEVLIHMMNEGVCVACYNSTTHYVFAGSKLAISDFEARIQSYTRSLSDQGNTSLIRHARLPVTHGFHSPIVDSFASDLMALASSVEIHKPSIPIESCTETRTEEFLTPQGIFKHSREPVFFGAAIERISKSLGSCTWIEAGAGTGITRLASNVLSSSERQCHNFVSLQLNSMEAFDSISKNTAHLWRLGHYCNFWGFHPMFKGDFVRHNLPPYQFEKRRHWLQHRGPHRQSEIPAAVSTEREHGSILSLISFLRPQTFTESLAEFAIETRNKDFQAYVSGHQVGGTGLCPASVYISLATQATLDVREAFWSSTHSNPSVHSLSIKAPLVLKEDQALQLSLSCYDEDPLLWTFTVSSSSLSDISKRTVHASGQVRLRQIGNESLSPSAERSAETGSIELCTALLEGSMAETLIDGSYIYKMFAAVVKYEKCYQGIRKIAGGQDELAGRVCVVAPITQPKVRLSWDPIVLDNFLQVAGIHANCLTDDATGSETTLVCVELGSVEAHPAFLSTQPTIWNVYCKRRSFSKQQMVYDISAYNVETQMLVLSISNARFVSTLKTSLSRNLAYASRSHGDASTTALATVTLQSAFAQSAPDMQPSDLPLCRLRSVEKRVADEVSTNPIAGEVRSLLSDLTDTPEKDICWASSLMDVGIDSLMMVETLTELEKKFSVKISISDFQSLETFGSLCTYMALKTHSSKGIEDALAPQSVDIEQVAKELELRKAATPEPPARILTPSSSSMSIDEPQTGSSGLLISPITQSPSSSHGGAELDTAVFARVAATTGLDGFYRDVHPHVLDLVVAYIVDGFARLGCDLNAEPKGQLIELPPHIDKHAKLVRQLGHTLVEAQILEMDTTGKLFRTAKDCPISWTTSEMVANIRRLFPQHTAEIELLSAAGPYLSDCLSGREEGVHLIFSRKYTKDLVEEVYAAAPMFATASKLLTSELALHIRHMPRERSAPLQIIELGAGTGGTTTPILELLDALGIAYRYTFTDISKSLISKARTKYAQRNVEFAALDIEGDLDASMLAAYDVVIATNVVHATKNLVTSCTNARKLLRNEGQLFLVELTRNLPWFDLVFGLLDGWWLFEDDRNHAIASEDYWGQCLVEAGFHGIRWTDDDSPESDLIRVITANSSHPLAPESQGILSEITRASDSSSNMRMIRGEAPVMETLPFDQAGNTPLYADVFYPPRKTASQVQQLPIAIMIHGGGHVMLSRKDIRPKQKDLLLEQGFLPISVDYRLCPEIDLASGPMYDVCTALSWCRDTLPQLTLTRPDIRPDGNRIVVVGWSTGGHLALSTAWTCIPRGIRPPDAILAFYCPIDYESDWWRTERYVWGTTSEDKRLDYDMWDSICHSPITGYNIPHSRVPGGWMSTRDPRARIPLAMNWSAQTLPMLLGSMTSAEKQRRGKDAPPADANCKLSEHFTTRDVQAVSPLAQARQGTYRVPTFLVHGKADDFMPWEHTAQFHDELQGHGVDVGMALVEGGGHMFEMLGQPRGDPRVWESVIKGYTFLAQKVGMAWEHERL